MKTWRPNQSGTFSNRINVHDIKDVKLFTIEFSEDVDNVHRSKIVADICSMHEDKAELLEALQLLLNAFPSDLIMNTGIDYIEFAKSAISKALSH